MKEGHYLCLLGIFDEETNHQFRLLDGHMQDAQLKTLGFYQADPWHFSLGVYFDLEPEELLAWVEEVTQDLGEIPLRFNHIGIFPGVVFLEPAFSWPLRLMYEHLHEKYDDLHGEYLATARRFGLFTPHVSLIFTYEELIPAVRAAAAFFEPFYGTLSELLIYEYVQKDDKSFPVGPVATIPLKKPDVQSQRRSP